VSHTYTLARVTKFFKVGVDNTHTVCYSGGIIKRKGTTMSNHSNDILLIRAYELADELVSDPAGRDSRIFQLIKENDLDTLREFVTKVEGELSQDHFNKNNLLEPTDVY
jgi:hypothetical protein